MAGRRGEGWTRPRSAVRAPHPRRAVRAPRVHSTRTNNRTSSNLHGVVAPRCVVAGVRGVWRVARNWLFKRGTRVGNRVSAVSLPGAPGRIRSSLDAFFGTFRAFLEVARVRRCDMNVELGFPIKTSGRSPYFGSGFRTGSRPKLSRGASSACFFTPRRCVHVFLHAKALYSCA